MRKTLNLLKFIISIIAFIIIPIIIYKQHLVTYPKLEKYQYQSENNCISYSTKFLNINTSKSLLGKESEVYRSLDLVKQYTDCIRIYDVEVAKTIIEYGKKIKLDIILGINIVTEEEKNISKLKTLVNLASSYNNIFALIIGNETIAKYEQGLFGGKSKEKLIEYIRFVKNKTKIPVSTSEQYHIWEENIDLANEVDFISAHFIPFWYRVPHKNSVSWVIEKRSKIQNLFPDKYIFIGETGWPSAGSAYGNALPSLENQISFFNQMSKKISSEKFKNTFFKYHFNLIEAYDQPWKKRYEGRNGPHWGLMYSNFDKKYGVVYPWTSPRSPIFWFLVGLSLSTILFCISLKKIINLPIALICFPTLIIHTLGFGISFFIMSLYQEYVFSSIFLTLNSLIALPIVILSIVMFYEVLSMKKNNDNKHFKDLSIIDTNPFVSIHLPCCNENPQMVIESLTSLLNLDYQNFEIIVVDNNTKDEKLWKPLEEFCESYDNIKFYHLAENPGFKAGALNFALSKTSSNTDFIAVVDSDYQVKSSWLNEGISYFTDSCIGGVQFPQSYRFDLKNKFHKLLNSEYIGFFSIGMINRDRDNAIIQHGTMLITRKKVVDEVGGWAEWCIVEDTELGIRILSKGYKIIYVNKILGHGIMPSNLSEYRKQRFRWAYGAIRVTIHHFTLLLFSKKLKIKQKLWFWYGWMPWFIEAAYLYVMLAAILLAYFIYHDLRYLPQNAFILPILLYFFTRIFYTLITYRIRISTSFNTSLNAIIAGISLTHTIGLATIRGIFDKNYKFKITNKVNTKNNIFKTNKIFSRLISYLELIFSILLISSSIMFLTRYNYQTDMVFWSATYLILALPGIATAIALLYDVSSKKN